MKVFTVLESWYRQNAFLATYSCIVEACLQLGDVAVAEDICKKLKGWLISHHATRYTTIILP